MTLSELKSHFKYNSTVYRVTLYGVIKMKMSEIRTIQDDNNSSHVEVCFSNSSHMTIEEANECLFPSLDTALDVFNARK